MNLRIHSIQFLCLDPNNRFSNVTENLYDNKNKVDIQNKSDKKKNEGVTY